MDRPESTSKIGIDLGQYEKMPLTMVKVGVVVTAKTDMGTLKLLVDTGACMSVIKREFVLDDLLVKDQRGNTCFVSSQLVLGDCDFGAQVLHPLSISSSHGNFDGVLGMDFLAKHAFFIDCDEGLIYFERPGSSSCQTSRPTQPLQSL